MVSDPRVSATLSRLSGVYRDLNRVERDASTLLKTAGVGSNLRPIAAQLYEKDGTSKTVLVLQGTIAMHFRGTTYQLLVDVYLPAGYPMRPPECFVRLADNMYLKENHRHVGSDGKVYLPYLHEWKSHSHNLVELVVAMSSVFSAEPPVFTRAPGSPAASTVAPTSTDTTSQSYSEAQLAAEAAELNAVAEAARRAEREEQEQARKQAEQARQLQAQQQWEEKRLNEIRQAVTAKIRAKLQETASRISSQIRHDHSEAQKLHCIKREMIDAQKVELEEIIKETEHQIPVAQEAKRKIETWLAEQDGSTNGDNGSSSKEQHSCIDDLVIPSTKVQSQMVALSAENRALEDALYYLDRALYKGQLDLDTHLKQVRFVAKRQFMVRAHLLKLHQVVASSHGR